jgi:hypothetical protein
MQSIPVTIAAVGVVMLSACSGSSADSNSTTPAAAGRTVSWPAPANAMELTRKAGLVPERAESLTFHVHSHLDVFVDGKPIPVPAGIGINISDPAVRKFPNPDGSTGYGGIDPACKQVCISPLHTHDLDGILHTESKTATPNRLGQFFTEWGVRLTPGCVGDFCEPKTSVAIYVDGHAYEGDPRNIELADRKEIAIVIGTPPPKIPSEFPPNLPG